MLIFFTEARFVKVNNDYYALDSSFSYALFERYLTYFDAITICARVREGKAEEILKQNKVNINNVYVFPLPYYVGFNQFIVKFFLLNTVIKQAVNKFKSQRVSFLCRIPGRVGATAIHHLSRNKLKYGVEIVGDPYDVLSNGATNHPFGRLIRFFSYRSLQKIAINAPMALYVTQTQLQKRYPNNHFNIGASDVIMPKEAFIDEGALKIRDSNKFKLICVGSLEQIYKAPDIMLDAVKIIFSKGYNVELSWVGDGLYKEKMIGLANGLGLADNVTFLGKLSSGAAVREQLDDSDIFVMPSRTEGLPRAMVEAMARGLPCIGTKLCGIQELIDERCWVNINDAEGLALKIIELIDNPSLRNKLSRQNLQKSYEYKEMVLKPKRDLFYNNLKNL